MGPFKTLHSTVQLKQTHILIQSLSRLGIITGTCLHSQNVDIMWDVIWQHPFLTSGQHELDFWNSIQKNMITILIHILQLSALYQNTGLSNCILGMGNLTGCVHVPVKYESFWKRISIKYNCNICFFGRYFWRHGETSEFCIVHNEPVLILLVCLQDRPRWS